MSQQPTRPGGTQTDQLPIRCRGLTKRFGRRTALAGLDLAVGPGEIVGCLGPNGAGKTTTLRLLTGALQPTGGTATVFGRDCWSSAAVVHAAVGWLPAELAVQPTLSGHRLLALSAALRGRPDRPAARAQNELAERLGVALDRRIGELSLGDRQKLAVVLALWHRPAVLLLDEPTACLDPGGRDTTRQLVLEAAGRGAAVLLCARALTEVEHQADRIVVLRDGRVVAATTVAELRNRPATYHLRITFADPADAVVLDRVAGLRPVRHMGATASCSAPHSALNALVIALATVPVVDLEIREADLAERYREACVPVAHQVADVLAPGEPTRGPG
jgi:ABC-2 type transport system ATP-binding protein